MKIITTSEKQTIALGKKLATQCKGGEVIGLIGELGAGKTVLIKGMTKGFDITTTITSPTFVLMKVYPVKSREAGISPRVKLFNRVNKIKHFVHVDAYRLKSSQGLIDIGLKDWLGKSNTVTVIEWADKVRDILPKHSIIITLKTGRKKNERIITITNYGKSIRT
ncbi:tRNA (adenosine(37)-N6)-threonylcarbamoyltransferase complex ATPase subunit type 1 TsaE [Patescibacteria group bacterium AH-259-L07]|nr:tRNA (adenosine(37)-N6)-threonylcarbamoyltransferase complex ATPase subunit type 1 TsaE [Patescibacteria group bacterium AH-259-L07]